MAQHAKLRCPSCDSLLVANASLIGKSVRCPHCRSKLSVSGQSFDDSLPEAAKPTAADDQNAPADLSASPDRESGSPPIGQLGRFTLQRVLGEGAFGKVYLAHDRSLDRRIALKVPTSDASFRKRAKRFITEAKSAAQLTHPHIVLVYDAGTEAGRHYIAYAYIEGHDLEERIKSERMEFRTAAGIVMKLAEGLDYAHSLEIIHRDVKPANVMVDLRGEPHLTDFGLALYESGDERITRDGSVLGTPAYMSPEQAGGAGANLTPASDQYSLGVMLYELLCGRTPFQGELASVISSVIHDEPVSPRSIDASIPRDLEIICLKAMAKEPDRRYANCQELADDLRRWLSDEPIHARRAGPAERLRRWCRREPVVAALSAATAALLVFVTFLSSWAYLHQRKLKEEAEAALSRESAAVEQANERLAENYLQRGLSLCRSGNIAEGLLWLTRGLDVADSSGSSLTNVIRVNLSMWSTRLRELHCSIHVERKILAAAFARDGSSILTVDTKQNVQQWNPETGLPIEADRLESAELNYASFSEDGRILATVSKDNLIRAWDTRTWRRIGEDVQHPVAVSSISLSPDGEMFATTGGDSVRLWNSNTGRLVGNPLVLEAVKNAIFSPDGSIIAGVGYWGTHAWYTASGKQIAMPQQVTEWLITAAITPDNQLLFTGGMSNSANLWSLHGTAQPIRSMNHESPVTSVACSHDGVILVTGSSDSSVRFWNNGTEMQLPIFVNGVVGSIAFNHDDTQLMIVSSDNVVRIWEANMPPPFRHSLSDGTGDVHAAVFTPDEDSVITSGNSHVQIWEVDTGRKRLPALAHRGQVRALAVSKSGGTLLTGSWDDSAKLWSISSGHQIGHAMNHQNDIVSVAFGPDDATVATGSLDGTARIWNAITGAALSPPLRHGGPVHAVAFSPKGGFLVSASSDGTARMWDTKTYQALGPGFQHEEVVYCVDVSPNGATLVTGGYDNTARMWNADTKQQVGKTLVHNGVVYSVRFSPTGGYVVTGSGDQTAMMWSVPDGEPMSVPLRQQGQIRSVAVSSDGKIVATAGSDNTAQLWDAETGIRLGPRLRHNERINTIEFSSSARWVVTTSLDDTARLWECGSPVEGEPEQVRLWVERLTGLSLDQKGQIHVLSPNELHRLKSQE